MIFDPPVMALLLASAFSTVIVALGAVFGVHVLLRWNLQDGHARQIRMEKRTYLVSTALMLVMVLQLAALVLFVHNADRMAVLFTGAMCAVGTLNVNEYGMPAFLIQVAVFFGAALWLIVNAADNMGRDYPYTRLKYGLLVLLAPLVVAGGVLEWLYFLNLDPNVITSCCSKLFTPENAGLQADLSSADPKLALQALFGGLGLLLALAAWAMRSRAGAAVYGIAGSLFFIVAIVAIISAVSSYIYETPNHHCPFCILKPQYGFIGYFLYLPLFLASAIAVGVGLLSLWPLPESLRDRLPVRLHHLVIASAGLFAVFGAVALYAILTSHLVMFR